VTGRMRTCVHASPADSREEWEKQFAVLPYEEFVLLKERLEDMEDLLRLRKARKGGRPEAHCAAGACEAGAGIRVSRGRGPGRQRSGHERVEPVVTHAA
jgi:hypothetical protein